MFENETKGTYGSYSEAGRNSVEKYHIIMQKDKILEGKTPKIKVHDFFSKEDEPIDINALMRRPGISATDSNIP